MSHRHSKHIGFAAQRRKQRARRNVSIAIAALLLTFAVGAFAYAFLEPDPVRIVVKDKESVTVDDGNGGSKNQYRVYTQAGTFKVSDTLFRLRFDSADEYATIENGKAYDCTSWGFRLPFFSTFKNLKDCEEVR